MCEEVSFFALFCLLLCYIVVAVRVSCKIFPKGLIFPSRCLVNSSYLWGLCMLCAIYKLLPGEFSLLDFSIFDLRYKAAMEVEWSLQLTCNIKKKKRVRNTFMYKIVETGNNFLVIFISTLYLLD